MDQKIKVLLVDDHQIVIDGIISILKEESLFEVVGQASNGREALEKIPQLMPQVVLLDLDMPVMNGMLTGQKIKNQFPDIKIIILSLHSEKSVIQHMLETGIDGYLVKDSDRQEMTQAIKAVMVGKKYFSSTVTFSLSSKIDASSSQSVDLQKQLQLLSPRERDVLKWIAEGYSNKEIAEKIDLSMRTVDAHRANLMKKLDIKKVTGLVRFAVKVGLID